MGNADKEELVVLPLGEALQNVLAIQNSILRTLLLVIGSSQGSSAKAP
jgi:hypothetical protein